jgi:hypothetical protein
MFVGYNPQMFFCVSVVSVIYNVCLTDEDRHQLVQTGGEVGVVAGTEAAATWWLVPIQSKYWRNREDEPRDAASCSQSLKEI